VPRDRVAADDEYLGVTLTADVLEAHEPRAGVVVRKLGAQFLALIWITVLIFFGIDTIRKGHWIMFFLGIIFPVLWVVGALIGPTRRAQAAGVV
jgi:Na+/phosphate symporter